MLNVNTNIWPRGSIDKGAASLLFNFNSRSGNTVLDSINSKTALLFDYRAASYNGGTKSTTGSNLSLSSTTKLILEFSLKFTLGASGGTPLYYSPIWGGNMTGIMISLSSADKLSIYFKNPGGSLNYATVNVAVSDGLWHDYRFEIDTTQAADTDMLTFFIDGVQKTGADIAIVCHTDRNWTFADYKLTTGGREDGSNYYTGEIANVNIRNDSSTFLELDDVYSCIDSSGNGNHIISNANVNIGYRDNCLKLTRGFTQYDNGAATPAEIQCCYKSDGTPSIAAATLTHNGTVYTKGVEYPAGQIHNYNDSIIDFNPLLSSDSAYDIFDRSNILIHTATSRSSIYYNAAKPFSYHISELNEAVLLTYLQAAYQGKIVIEFTGQLITAIKAYE